MLFFQGCQIMPQEHAYLIHWSRTIYLFCFIHYISHSCSLRCMCSNLTVFFLTHYNAQSIHKWIGRSCMNKLPVITCMLKIVLWLSGLFSKAQIEQRTTTSGMASDISGGENLHSRWPFSTPYSKSFNHWVSKLHNVHKLIPINSYSIWYKSLRHLHRWEKKNKKKQTRSWFSDLKNSCTVEGSLIL